MAAFGNGHDDIRGEIGKPQKAADMQARVLLTVFYFTLMVPFGVVFGLFTGWDLATQYFAGYIVEKSLSVDNLFVFLIIMSTFAVPPEQQARALTIGIVAALLLRAIFIGGGATSPKPTVSADAPTMAIASTRSG